MPHDPLGPAGYLGDVLRELAKTIDARAEADPELSWTAKLLLGGPSLTAKKLGEEAIELALAVVSQGDAEVAGEAADVIYHLLVALRSRGVPLDQVAKALEARQGKSGIDEKASRPDRTEIIMPETFAQRIAQLDAHVRELHRLTPDAVAAYGALSKQAQVPGALDGKTKELIALAISVATRCDGCIAYHARGAVRQGASRQEVAEALAVTLQMGGGPSMVHSSDALRAYDEFAAAAAAPAATKA